GGGVEGRRGGDLVAAGRQQRERRAAADVDGGQRGLRGTGGQRHVVGGAGGNDVQGFVVSRAALRGQVDGRGGSAVAAVVGQGEGDGVAVASEGAAVGVEAGAVADAGDAGGAEPGDVGAETLQLGGDATVVHQFG